MYCGTMYTVAGQKFGHITIFEIKKGDFGLFCSSSMHLFVKKKKILKNKKKYCEIIII